MKKYFGKLCLGGVFLFSLSMSLTSCEDILGEWSRPTPGNNTPSGGGSSTIAITSVTLNKAYLRFDKNVLTAQTLTATVAPDDATDKTVTWESSDESVATVDENGQVTPKTKGTVTITATAHDGSGIKATSTVIVYDKIVDISSGAVTVTANEEWLINGNGTATAVTNGITIGDGATVTLKGINISKQIACAGTATIILADGSTNTVDASGIDYNAAIKVGGAGKTLTIDAETEGTGTLTAKGGSNAAGIGTSRNETGGNIVINGGRVTATGGLEGAGIGTGLAEVLTKFGDITINGGTVTATGGGSAAGIGTGRANNGSNTCGAITIIDGTVTAEGGDSGAGIGTGDAVSNTNTCGAITINGGTVTAKGGYSGAGIGTGNDNGWTNKCDDIKINGGTVIATGGEKAAGIGTGAANNETNECGAITIGTGVTSVTATKGTGTGSFNSIGTGKNSSGTQKCGTITIGGVEYWDGAAYQNGGNTYLTGDIIYTPAP